MQTYNLESKHDGRKSFYGKARVTETDDTKVLTSYQTEVAKISNGKATINGTYSDTTLRHIKEFLKQNGFEASSKKQVIKDYMER